MIRRAQAKDMERIMALLTQVNLVHHRGRPDIFNAATKYTEAELSAILANDMTPVFVSVDEHDEVEGYTFCVFKQFIGDHMMTDIKTLYIDDLCVDEALRGRHIGQGLYRYVVDYARASGCYNVTLNVWACNEAAIKFYEKCGLKMQKMGMECIL